MVKATGKSAQPAKTAVKKPRKVFDVSGSGKGSAASAANAKRVIISHHPIMQDPEAVAPDGELPAREAAAKTPTATKVVIKPLSEKEKATDLPTDRIELDIPDFDVKEKPEQKVETPAPEETALTPKEVAEKPAQPETTDAEKSAEETPAKDSKEATAPLAEDTKEETLEEPKESEKLEEETAKPEPAAAPLSPENTDLPGGESGSDKTKEEQEAAALEAEVKRQEEFDKLEESKEYFLPITTAEHRRSKLVTITGLILIVLLGLLLVNLLMDVGTIRINGVEPLTQFFGS